jgi:uncharacterized delta-60 repeat protein
LLARFDRNGSLDTSFGTGGVVVLSGTGGATGLVLQPDGKLVVKNFNSLVRLRGDGTLDTSFGGDGSVHTEVEVSLVNLANPSLVLQPDGKLVVAGSRPRPSDVELCSSSFEPCARDFALERFNPDGNRDTSFGSGGIVVTNFGEASVAHALVLQADGRLVYRFT